MNIIKKYENKFGIYTKLNKLSTQQDLYFVQRFCIILKIIIMELHFITLSLCDRHSVILHRTLNLGIPKSGRHSEKILLARGCDLTHTVSWYTGDGTNINFLEISMAKRVCLFSYYMVRKQNLPPFQFSTQQYSIGGKFYFHTLYCKIAQENYCYTILKV